MLFHSKRSPKRITDTSPSGKNTTPLPNPGVPSNEYTDNEAIRPSHQSPANTNDRDDYITIHDDNQSNNIYDDNKEDYMNSAEWTNSQRQQRQHQLNTDGVYTDNYDLSNESSRNHHNPIPFSGTDNTYMDPLE